MFPFGFFYKKLILKTKEKKKEKKKANETLYAFTQRLQLQ